MVPAGEGFKKIFLELSHTDKCSDDVHNDIFKRLTATSDKGISWYIMQTDVHDG